MPEIRDEGQKTPSNAFKHVYDRQTRVPKIKMNCQNINPAQKTTEMP